MPDERPVLDQLNIVVRDMGATVAFYRRLGLDIPETPPEWADQHRNARTGSGLDLDFDSVAFASAWDTGWPSGATGVVIGFRLATREAVDERYADLTQAGYCGQMAPCDAFWGARYAVVEDPSGNAVGLMSPVDPEQRAASPASPA